MTSIPIIQLHNRVNIPELGYRIDKDHPEKIYDSILIALDAGFRHFDLPCDAHSEELAGKAFRDSGIPRYELFLTMKLGNKDHGYKNTLHALDRSLKRTGTDYADLFLINWPNPLQYRDEYETISIETWRGLETSYKNGKAHAIGLANYESRHIEHILDHAEIAPMLNQARIYPGFPFTDNLSCANLHNIKTEGFLPPDHDAILQCEELRIFANKYNTTTRNICIRYLLEKKCIALLQGNTLEDFRDATQAYDFRLSDKDMKYLDAMKNYGLENINPDTCDF